jgi:hypothetical protein
MGFKLSEIFGPGYKQKNPEVRKDAVKTLTNTAILSEMAEKDVDPGVREAAKKRLESLKK